MDITQITQSGFRWAIRVPKGYQDEHIIFEVVASDVYHLRELAEHIQPETILDVGGHIGTFGVFAKSLWPQAHLIVVEPSRENLILYQRNIALNHIKNVVFWQGAMSYQTEPLSLLNSPTTTGGCLACTHQKAEEYIHRQYRSYDRIREYHVPCITVEELTKEFSCIDLAKWDCEGGEIEAFKNMRDDTAMKFRFMVGEYHIWNENTDYLRPSLFDCIQFWRGVKKKFPHLNFNYKDKPLGNFQAWPKGECNGSKKENNT